MSTIHNSHSDSHHNNISESRSLPQSRLSPLRELKSVVEVNRRLILDEALERLQSASGRPLALHATLDEMIEVLRDVKRKASPEEWSAWTEDCRRHSITELLHEDPFTRRAYEKPRGYAGDAELIDMIYGLEEMWTPPVTSLMGSQIFEYTTRAPAPEGVRARRAFVAAMIDRLARRNRFPSILSLAAGHMREALLSAAFKRRRLGRVVALDSDPLSMQLVEREYGCFGVETEVQSIRKLFCRKVNLGTFDFVYSTGLFDYLNEDSSRRLATIMFEMLNPGGRLLVANFLPGIRDIGYMEVFMDWNLIFRTRHEMMNMTMDIPQEEIRGIRVFAEENQNIIFLEVTKR